MKTLETEQKERVKNTEYEKRVKDKRKKELLGKKARVPLVNYDVPILEDERVDPKKGSGVVMCCTFGDQTDMEWYFAHNLPLKMSLTKDGKMTKLAEKYEGMRIKEARKKIIEDLKAPGFSSGRNTETPFGRDDARFIGNQAYCLVFAPKQ